MRGIRDEDIKANLPSNPVFEGSSAGDLAFSGCYTACAMLASASMNTVRSIYSGKDKASRRYYSPSP